MSEVVSLRRQGDDTLWAVMASIGKRERIAEIYASRVQALADRSWREQQVRAYASLFLSAPPPRYSVAPIRRQDLPRAWTPLPALGFLRGGLF